MSFTGRYEFAQPVDLSEGEKNDAVFIDITILQGSAPLNRSKISAGVVAANGAFGAFAPSSDYRSQSPYTIILPFSHFGNRERGRPQDFSSIESLSWSIGLLSGSRDPNTEWFVQIDRIRVGRAVPEPVTWELAAVAAAIIAMNPLSVRTT